MWKSVQNLSGLGRNYLVEPEKWLAIFVYKGMEAYGLVALAETTPVDALPNLIGLLAQAKAIAQQRLLAPAPPIEPPRLVSRKEAAKILGVSIYYLEAKRLPISCEQKIGRRTLYNLQLLTQYIKQGHVPFQGR